MEAKTIYIWNNVYGKWRYEVEGFNNRPIDQEFKSFRSKWYTKYRAQKIWGKSAQVVYAKPYHLGV